MVCRCRATKLDPDSSREPDTDELDAGPVRNRFRAILKRDLEREGRAERIVHIGAKLRERDVPVLDPHRHGATPSRGDSG